jgi:hypothetical protein
MNYVPVFAPESSNRINKFKVDYWTPSNSTIAYPQPNQKFQAYNFAGYTCTAMHHSLTALFIVVIEAPW